jgi:predicted AAA+ superfamily ATPase
MERLFYLSNEKIKETNTDFKRFLYSKIDWNDRLIAIKGARGVGKTTLILQYIKEHLVADESVLYVSLDHIYFSKNRLIDLADDFVKNGGCFLFLDEVHKYENWSIEIKNIYDQYSKLKIVFTGSSMLQLYKGQGDLSRRMVSYNLPGLSFREFIAFERNVKLPVLNIKELISNHIHLSNSITAKIKPLPIFKEYLSLGYYPYYKEGKNSFHLRLLSSLNVVLENDIAYMQHIDYPNVNKLKKLLYVISASVPFRPNISKISESLEVSRNTVLQYLQYLHDAQLIYLLRTESEGISYLSKPEKIYLHNTNLMQAIGEENANKGNIRETFFVNQLSAIHKIAYPEKGDFLVNTQYIFEVGGKNKDYQQIKNINNSFVAADEIECGYKNKIPLWLFGFLY